MPQDWEAGRRWAWYRSRCVVEETHFPPSNPDMKRKKSERGTLASLVSSWGVKEPAWGLFIIKLELLNESFITRGSGESPLHWDVGQGSRDRSLMSEVWPGGGVRGPPLPSPPQGLNPEAAVLCPPLARAHTAFLPRDTPPPTSVLEKLRKTVSTQQNSSQTKVQTFAIKRKHVSPHLLKQNYLFLLH